LFSELSLIFKCQCHRHSEICSFILYCSSR